MRKFFFAAATALAALFGSASSADASFAIRITDSVTGPGGITIMDNGSSGAFSDSDGRVNHITVTYFDTAYTLIGTISFTNTPGTPNLAILDVSFNLSTKADGLGGPAGTGGAATL